MHLVVSKPGYETYKAVMQTRLDNWFWGNIIIGGVLGSTTDLATGTTHLLDPSHIHIQMVKNDKKTGHLNEDLISEVQEYAILNYKNLLKYINFNQGSYLNSLKKLKNVTDEGKFLAYLKEKSSSANNALEFSLAVEKFWGS
jgi:hypothetical protein